MFEGFKLEFVDTGEATIRARVGGSGPPLLLLHGHPQTHVMWRDVAANLAQTFTVVAADLRGYGESSKPPTTPDHEPYSKRAMARDNLAVMRHFGFDRFFVAGHDRGGRCAYRLALDHPDRVRGLAVLDILPTSEHFRRADMQFGMGYWHWFFLAQPADMPERVIGCPVLVLWAARGALPKWYDVLGVWRDWADDVRGRAIDAGHFIPEEAPDATVEEFRAFFGGLGSA